MSDSLWSTIASGVVALGALLVLIGSCNQAWGNLLEYRNLVTPPQLEANGRILKFVSEKGQKPWIGSALQVLSLAGVALSRETPGKPPQRAWMNSAAKLIARILPAGPQKAQAAGEQDAGSEVANGQHDADQQGSGNGSSGEHSHGEHQAGDHGSGQHSHGKQVADPEKEMKQALHVAAAWALILFGSLAALMASVVQLILAWP